MQAGRQPLVFPAGADVPPALRDLESEDGAAAAQRKDANALLTGAADEDGVQALHFRASWRSASQRAGRDAPAGGRCWRN